MQAKNHMTKFKKLSSKLRTLNGIEIRLHYSNTVIRILRSFRTNGRGKWRNRFKNKKIVVSAEYFEQETNCSRYRRKNSQSRRSSSWINQSYLVLLIKQIETKPRSHKQSAT